MEGWNDDTPGLVVLPDGRRVRGRGLRSDVPADSQLPEFGLYLTGTPRSDDRWGSRWLCWPDFRLPRSVDDAVVALRDLHHRSASQRVEVACGGGIGRTGTAIALLARLAGIPAADAVAWTRMHYLRRAVETPGQRRFVARVDLS